MQSSIVRLAKVLMTFLKIKAGTVFALLLVLLTLGLITYNAKLITFDDAQVARRALLLASASDDLSDWNVTLAFPLLNTLLKPLVESLYALRLAGVAIVCLSALFFALIGGRGFKDLRKTLLLFLSGLGLYTFQPGNMPEFNHLAIFSVYGIGALVIYLNRKDLKLEKLSLVILAVLLGLFLGVNLSSAFLGLIVFGVYWLFPQPTKKSVLEYLFVISIAALFYGCLSLHYGIVTAQAKTPGLRYFSVAISELEQFSLPRGNILYLLLRGTMFALELILLVPIFFGAYFIGKKYRKNPNGLCLWVLIPVFWILLSVGFTFYGMKAYQLPSEWSFSPTFFFGKFVWYGFATALPLLILLAMVLGLLTTKFSFPDRRLLIFLLVFPLCACFGSAARWVHKIQMYLPFVTYNFLMVLENSKEKRISLSGLEVVFTFMIGIQACFGQLFPVTVNGGYKTFREKLDPFPKGAHLLGSRSLYDWAQSLQEASQKTGIRKGEAVLSNDVLAIYLLGFHQAVLNTEGTERKFPFNGQPMRAALVLKQKEEEEKSMLDSSLLKIIGPPTKKAETKALQEQLSMYIVRQGAKRQAIISRGSSETEVYAFE